MPADRLELQSHEIRTQYLNLAIARGKWKGGYAHVAELPHMSAVLHCRGFRTDINKLVFRNASRLGYGYCKKIAREVFRDPSNVATSRVDWCADLAGLSVWDLALYLRLGNIQNCRVIRSRTGPTFYPHFSEARTVLLYDKLRELKFRHDPLFKHYAPLDSLTRVEVQYRRNLPYKRFDQLSRYSELTMLPNLSFWEVGIKKAGLKTKDDLAARGLLRLIEENGLQFASKKFTSQEWAYLTNTLLERIPDSQFPDINKLLQKSARDWLEDRIRFPRFPEDVKS